MGKGSKARAGRAARRRAQGRRGRAGAEGRRALTAEGDARPQLSGKAAAKAEKKRKKAAKARADKAVEPVTWTDALRVGPGFRLADLDPRSTPGLHAATRPTGKEVMGELQARLGDLQERLFAESKGGGDALGAARHPGHGHLRQGRHHAPRRRRRRPAGRADHLVQGAERRGEATPVPLAHPARAATTGPDRGVRPQPLRGRAHRAGARPGAAHHVVAPLRADQRLRAGRRRRRHRGRQGDAAHLRRRAEGTPRRAARARGQALEVQPGRHRRARPTGPTTCRPTRPPSRSARRTPRRGSSCPPTASGTPGSPCTNLLLEHLEAMDPKWPAADFDVEEQKERLALTP